LFTLTQTECAGCSPVGLFPPGLQPPGSWEAKTSHDWTRVGALKHPSIPSPALRAPSPRGRGMGEGECQFRVRSTSAPLGSWRVSTTMRSRVGAMNGMFVLVLVLRPRPRKGRIEHENEDEGRGRLGAGSWRVPCSILTCSRPLNSNPPPRRTRTSRRALKWPAPAALRVLGGLSVRQTQQQRS